MTGGDAESGFGLDLGGGLALAAPGLGLQAELRARGLLSHEAGGFRERGLSGSLAWRQQPDSPGPGRGADADPDGGRAGRRAARTRSCPAPRWRGWPHTTTAQAATTTSARGAWR